MAPGRAVVGAVRSARVMLAGYVLLAQGHEPRLVPLLLCYYPREL